MAVGDEPVDDGAQDEGEDPDRAAILARRQRFIALAISGLATTACKHGAPEPCLSVVAPDEGGEGEEPSGLDGPIVEDPGVPLQSGGEGEGEVDPGVRPEPPPQPCLNVLAPQPCLKTAAPKPCLKKKKAAPKVCLIVAD